MTPSLRVSPKSFLIFALPCLLPLLLLLRVLQLLFLLVGLREEAWKTSRRTFSRNGLSSPRRPRRTVAASTRPPPTLPKVRLEKRVKRSSTSFVEGGRDPLPPAKVMARLSWSFFVSFKKAAWVVGGVRTPTNSRLSVLVSILAGNHAPDVVSDYRGVLLQTRRFLSFRWLLRGAVLHVLRTVRTMSSESGESEGELPVSLTLVCRFKTPTQRAPCVNLWRQHGPRSHG